MDELRKALEPFARLLKHDDDRISDAAMVVLTIGVRKIYGLSLRDLRRARDALAASSPPIGSDLDGYVLREALEYYAGTYCEGWCRDGGYFDDCGGCRARQALAAAPPVPSSAVDVPGEGK